MSPLRSPERTVPIHGRRQTATAQLAALLVSARFHRILAALSAVALVATELAAPALAPVALLPLLAVLVLRSRLLQSGLERLLELNDAYHGTALVLGNVVVGDDGYTDDHNRGVVALCMDVADRLDLTAEQRRKLEFGALLHDVGAVAIPPAIINKPGKLDPAEWSVISTHTIEGQELLDAAGGFMREVGLIVRSHHERWDGAGYPDGLAGEAIPLESRIIACCETWHAMRTDRSYRSALPFEAAAHELRTVAGSQLDQRIVTELLDVVEAERPLAPDRIAA